MSNKQNHLKIYEGWELEFFDKALNFRKYQFDLIGKHIKGQVAEIGPGNGTFYKFYRDLSSEIHLYEPSINFLEKLEKQKYSNTQIFVDYFQENINFYDTILYLDVIEHIENDFSEIKKAYGSLKTGGKLIINVPAFQHLYSNFDRDINHFKRYSKKDFKKIAKQLDAKIIQLKYYDSIGYFLSFLSKIFNQNYINNFENKIKIWNSLIPASRFLDLITQNNFGKSLIFICEKK
jgi:2-polyprenyl-3-methyl-5-hydroxy-6-metoxy-1,4-benzoquinol methylase